MANPVPPVAYQAIPIMQVDQDMLRIAPPVYIFNVGPDQHVVSRGGLGTFIIPKCEQGQKVSAPLELTGLYPEQRNLGEAVVQNYLHGKVIAQDILGTASSLPTKHEFTTNLEWKGCFISESKTPSAEVIANANAKRRDLLQWFVEDGDRRSLMGPGDNGTGGIGPNHRNAVAELKLKREWATSAVAQEECPACGSGVKSGIAVCPKCTAVLDETLARKYFPERFQSQGQNVEATKASIAVASNGAASIDDRSKAGK